MSLPPLVQLIVFLVLVAPAFAARRWPASPLAGAVIMALGIFGLAAVPRLGDAGAASERSVALAVLALWGWCALVFTVDWLRGRRPGAVPPMARFAFGTWVAGTAVTASLLHAAFPAWDALYWMLGVATAALWLWFLPVAFAASRALGAAFPTDVTGAVLLVTVSTQSLALLAASVPWRGAALAAAAFVALGAVFYGAGLALMAPSLARMRLGRLADDWDNSNCILHGAASITGLAAIEAGIFPVGLCAALWLYAGLVFLLVEAIELLRLSLRVRAYGVRAAVLRYSESQWARNFTFGMLLAFTAAFHALVATRPGLGWIEPLQTPVLDFSAWLVLALLLAETCLALAARGE